MQIIKYNYSGTMDKLPRYIHSDNPLHNLEEQHWFIDPTAPSFRLVSIVPDWWTGGADVAWQDRTQRVVFAGSGAYEADMPPVRPPESPLGSLNLVYRIPNLHAQGAEFVTEFGDVWKMKFADGFSLFSRYNKGEDITPQLSQIKALGFNGVRVFFSAFYDFGKFGDLWPRRGDYSYARVESFLDLVNHGYGLHVEVTHGDLQVVLNDKFWQMSHFGQMGDILRTRRANLMEYANEWEKNGLWRLANGAPDPEVVKRIPGVLVNVGSSFSDGPCWIPALDWASHHGRRGNFDASLVEQAKALDSTVLMHIQHGGFDLVGVGELPVALNETVAATNVVLPGKEGSRTTEARWFERMARMASAFGGSCFHFEDGIYGNVMAEGSKQLAAAKAYIRGAN